jgi:hypothetical protein
MLMPKPVPIGSEVPPVRNRRREAVTFIELSSAQAIELENSTREISQFETLKNYAPVFIWLLVWCKFRIFVTNNLSGLDGCLSELPSTLCMTDSASF